MSTEKTINGTKLRVVKEDITLMEVQAFVYYAQHDLKLGSGTGNAITLRGGPSVEKEATALGPIETTEAVVSGAGELKAEHIIHAVGPRFQELETEQKLHSTMVNLLKRAEEKGIETLALPIMGYGFYGVPLDVSAKISLKAIKEHLGNGSKLKELTFCVFDNKQIPAFEKELQAL
jgi:O-acetyl-ADP-ribose deacetylase (regulator of RNase III)